MGGTVSREIVKSSHQRCSVKEVVLRNFAKLTGIHVYQSLFFNKVAGATLLKKRLWYWSFPVNFAKLLRPPFLQNISGRLLLNRNLTKFSFNSNYFLILSNSKHSHALSINKYCIKKHIHWGIWKTISTLLAPSFSS